MFVICQKSKKQVPDKHRSLQKYIIGHGWLINKKIYEDIEIRLMDQRFPNTISESRYPNPYSYPQKVQFYYLYLYQCMNGYHIFDIHICILRITDMDLVKIIYVCYIPMSSNIYKRENRDERKDINGMKWRKRIGRKKIKISVSFLGVGVKNRKWRWWQERRVVWRGRWRREKETKKKNGKISLPPS